MDDVEPELNFSVSELEQAGLLSCAQPQPDEVSSRPAAALTTADNTDNGNSADHCTTIQGAYAADDDFSTPHGHEYLSHRKHTSAGFSEVVPVHTQDTRIEAPEGSPQWVIQFNNRKAAANREHQKRWRTRQKVCQL